MLPVFQFKKDISGLSGVVHMFILIRRRFVQSFGPYQDYKGKISTLVHVWKKWNNRYKHKLFKNDIDVEKWI